MRLTIGERLKVAINKRYGFGGVSKFERLAQAAGKKAGEPRGFSRQTLHRYFRNAAKPTPAVITIAAQVLSVREEWLITGLGGMDQEEERQRMVREAAASRSFQDIDHLLAQVKTSTGLDLGGTATPAAAFLDLSLRYWTWAATRMRGVPPNTIHDVLGGLIVHPLKELGIRYNPNSEAFRDYVTSMALALMLGIRADQPEED